MMRSWYRLLVALHPPGFRRRFGDEMMSVFDESADGGRWALVVDGAASCARQWVLRTDSWKVLLAVLGGLIQVFGFGVPVEGHPHWAENRQALTDPMQQILLFALALISSLFIAIVCLSLWNMGLQRRRLARHMHR